MRDPNRAALLRQVIDEYLEERLSNKAKTAKQDKETFTAKYELRNWARDAAHRAPQLKLATHVLKATHQDARGTNVYCAPEDLPPHTAVGTGSLSPDKFETDVVGNAAALDVYAFLCLRFENQTIVQLMEQGDEDLLHLLADEPSEAKDLAEKFLQIRRTDQQIVSSGLAKQLYWLVGDEPSDNNQYHLLAPFYASSLTNYVYKAIQKAKIGETRQLRKKNEYSELVSADYINLAVQKIGGSQPQNISKLNSARKGINYLLASEPPKWKAASPYIFRRASFFGPYLRRIDEIGDAIDELRTFLESNPAPNMATRDHRDALLMTICQEILATASELELLAPGWSSDSRCRLPDCEKLWLDPERADTDERFAEVRLSADWRTDVVKSFAVWLARELGQDLPLGDIERVYFRTVFEITLALDGSVGVLVH